MTNQPEWEFVANLGDATPLEHGGYFVFKDQTGVYGFEAERVELDEEAGTLEVHRVCLDQLKEVRVDNQLFLVTIRYAETWPHPLLSYEEWFVDSLKDVASTMGTTEEELRRMFCSEDGLERAEAYRCVYDHHGWANGDEYPLQLTYVEALQRYQEDALKPDGYSDCECCGETIMDALICEACVKAGCEAEYEYGWTFECQIPQCTDCCDGEGPRASLMNDGKWHSNCDEDCANTGKSWAAEAGKGGG